MFRLARGMLPARRPASGGSAEERGTGRTGAAAGSAKLIRAGVETPLAAKPGDILFSGDAMKTEAAPASFLYCPSKSSQSLAAAGDVLFGPNELKIRAGKIADPKPMGSCFLPQVVRVAVASQQHYGVSMTRGLKDDTKQPQPVPPDKWPAAAAAEIAPFDKALAADPEGSRRNGRPGRGIRKK